MKVAIVDDDVTQIELISRAVSGLGHDCQGFERGQALLRQMRRDTFDLLILDWHLPDTSGPEIVTWVRGKIAHRVPILFVTNRNQEGDVIEALTCGADDYLPKPVRVGELAARVAALMRRTYPVAATDIEVYGRFTIDAQHRKLYSEGTVIELKLKEYELAHLLFNNLGRLLSRQYLIDRIWGVNPEIWSRSLDTHVSSLRNKLDLRPQTGYRLSAVYGMGYRLEMLDERGHARAPEPASAPVTTTTPPPARSG